MARELTREEKRAIRALVTKWCANYDRECGCLPLDCECYMLGKCWTGALCRYFREAVLPLDPALEAALLTEGPRPDFKICPICGGPVAPDRRQAYPKLLFRYRPVSTKSLEALRTNKLYFSSANYYDDPFDTFLHIDIEAIRKEYLSAFQTPESTEAVVDGVKSLLGNILSEEQAAQFTVENVTNALSHGLTESFLNAALSLRDEVKKDTWSVCFSENGFNEVLWLKYADQHRGFVQIYDLENNDNFLCGKQEKCANCGIKNYGTPLYPIYYSDTPYDATKFAKFVMLRKIAETTATQIPPELYAGMGSALWEQERTTLIKKECHKYDEEWRMITGCIMKPPVMMEWIPSGIILGLRMGVAEENLVVSMAKEAGIKNIYKSYINAQNKLDAYPLKL